MLISFRIIVLAKYGMLCGITPTWTAQRRLRSVSSVFAVRSMGSLGPKLSSCGRRRLRSAWVAAQSDLSLRCPQIRIFAVRIKKSCVLSYPLSAHLRLWSDWAHRSFCWFCRVSVPLLLCLFAIISSKPIWFTYFNDEYPYCYKLHVLRYDL